MTFKVSKSNVAGATRDCARNLTGSKGGGCVKANIKSFHCFLHMLHLVVWDGIIKTEIVYSVVGKASKISIGFHRTPRAIAKLCEVQGEGSKTLILQIKTRWNSTFEMLSSASYHKSSLLQYAKRNAGCSIAKHIKSMLEADYDEITNTVEVLKSIKDCTKMDSYGNAPLSCYPFFVKKLSEYLENLFGEFVLNLHESLESRARGLLNQLELEYASF